MVKTICFFVAMTIIAASMRFAVPSKGLDLTSPTIFKDLAHVYVGFLFGVGFVGLLMYHRIGKLDRTFKSFREETIEEITRFCVFLGVLAILLTIIEVIAAVVK